VKAVPLTFPVANEMVRIWHRHHDALPGGFAWFCVGAVADGRLVGAAIAGRPTNRNNDDKQTVEVLRLATDGTRNACSFLLGRCAKAARAIGASRIITYTLSEESGSSLKASGWRVTGREIRSWWEHPGSRTPAKTRPHMGKTKTGWLCALSEPVAYDVPELEDHPDSRQPSLFAPRGK